MDIASFRTQTHAPIWTKAKLGLDDLIISRVNTWVPAEPKTLETTQGHCTILRLQVRKFDTSNIDFHNLSEAEKHTDGNPWGLTGLNQAEIDTRNFICKSIVPYTLSKTDTHDVISRSFFAAVAHYLIVWHGPRFRGSASPP